MKGDGDVEGEDEHVDGRQSEETRHVEQRPVQASSRLLQHLQRPERHEETTAKTREKYFTRMRKARLSGRRRGHRETPPPLQSLSQRSATKKPISQNPPPSQRPLAE